MKLYIRILQKIWIFLFSFGCLILVINIIGLIHDFYAVENMQNICRVQDTVISYECARNNIKYLKHMKQNNIHMDYFEFINNIVSMRMSNLLSEAYSGENLYRISIFDNWILWVKTTILDPDCQYEFADPYRALKMGAGFCSQQGIVVAELLREFGYQAGVLDLKGHVVAWVKSDKGIYILDPDYGVILPFDLAQACSNKERLREYYRNMKLQMLSKAVTEMSAQNIAEIYCKNDGKNIAYTEGVDGYCGQGYKKYEDNLYILKWAIPGFFIFLSVIGYLLLMYVNRMRKTPF